MQTSLQDIIRTGQENNQILKDMTPEDIAEILFIAGRGVIFDWCLHEGQYDLKEKMDVLFTRLVSTFATN